MTKGRRGCALKLAVGLHVLGWVALVAGCLTPYWAKVENSATGEVISNRGLLTTCDEDWNCEVIDLNVYSDLTSNKASLYGMLAVTFGIVAMVTQFFVVQTYCFASNNKSCGKTYSPDGLIIFSLLTGFVVVTCLAMFELQVGRSLSDSTTVKLDYSRGFVMLAAGLIFLGCFITICDRKPEQKK